MVSVDSVSGLFRSGLDKKLEMGPIHNARWTAVTSFWEEEKAWEFSPSLPPFIYVHDALGPVRKFWWILLLLLFFLFRPVLTSFYHRNSRIDRYIERYDFFFFCPSPVMDTVKYFASSQNLKRWTVLIFLIGRLLSPWVVTHLFF